MKTISAAGETARKLTPPRIAASRAASWRAPARLIERAYSRRFLSVLLWTLAIALGALHAWAGALSHSMNADGINYLDIGDAYLRGDWAAAVNPVWSPLYSWVLGLALRLLNPPMRWEFPAVHLVNFLIYLGALAAFAFFWRPAERFHLARVREAPGDEPVMALPDWAWPALGYSLFIWTSLSLIKVWAVTPDMLMAALVYLAAGLVLRLRLGLGAWRTFAGLGALLGLGYLAKAVMLPLAFAFLAVGVWSVRDRRLALRCVALALVAFVLVAGPFVGAISFLKGRLTFGEAGALTYARYVNGIPYPHWRGETPGLGAPVHPSRRILDAPPIYEFGAPVGGTYPISYDPSYWYEGMTPRVEPLAQGRALLSSALFYFDLFFRQQGVWLLGILVLYRISRWAPLRPGDLLVRWGLALVAAVAFGLYALVYVEGRYVAVFVALLWADLLANVRLPAAPASRTLAAWVPAAMLVMLLLNILAFNLEGFSALADRWRAPEPAATAGRPLEWPGEVAAELRRLGVGPGARVAVIGYAFDSYWARLARVKIVAEMLDVDAHDFWIGEAAVQAEVIRAFAATGATAIVAEHAPGYASLPGWRQVGDSNYYIYVLRR